MMHAPRPIVLAMLAALTACSPASDRRDPDAAARNAAMDSEVAAVLNLQDATEIDALKARVVALEREVGEMKANPQTLDLELLTQRVQRLEAGPLDNAATPTETSPRSTAADADRAQRAVDASIEERRSRRKPD